MNRTCKRQHSHASEKRQSKKERLIDMEWDTQVVTLTILWAKKEKSADKYYKQIRDSNHILTSIDSVREVR